MTSFSDMLVDCELLMDDNLPDVVLGHDAKGNLVLLLAGDCAVNEGEE